MLQDGDFLQLYASVFISLDQLVLAGNRTVRFVAKTFLLNFWNWLPSFPQVFLILQQVVSKSKSNNEVGSRVCPTDAFTFLIPSFSIIFIFAHIDRNTKRLREKITSSIVSKTDMPDDNEDLLVLLYRCKFTTEAFLVFDTSYATVGKVIFSITPQWNFNYFFCSFCSRFLGFFSYWCSLNFTNFTSSTESFQQDVIYSMLQSTDCVIKKVISLTAQSVNVCCHLDIKR